ncbi:xylulokinase (plasmid) [Thermus oshimai]|uniref:xylulokinase n=1 Tax=Thermus oshimai TaxID=56957 RepID=UPI0039A6CFCA
MEPPVFLGVDLGTSSVKVLALTLEPVPRVAGRGRATYAIQSPQPGWAEQDPKAWWRALRRALHQALSGGISQRVAAIGLSGQMHGVVLVDQAGALLYPAVIWADGRGASLLSAFRRKVPPPLWPRLGSPPAPGLAALTLLWFRRHRPELLRKAAWALTPKDWLRLALTGEAGTEPSDASATLLFSVPERVWDLEVIDRLGLEPTLLPPLQRSDGLAGSLTSAAARYLGLPPGLPVIAGAADQAAAALGNGILREGQAQLMLGSGGQALSVRERPESDPTLKTHLFCHCLPGRWYRLGAVLNVGLAWSWLAQALGTTLEGFSRLARKAQAGAQGVVFYPYLLGERTPYMNPNLNAGWRSLRAYHTRAHLARAGLEGIAFSLREAVEALDLTEGTPLRLAGGGIRDSFWLQILADVLGRPLFPGLDPDASAWGAALLAALGVGCVEVWALAMYTSKPP